MKKLLSTTALAALSSLALAQNQQPRNLIMYIGDGFGISAKTAARMSLGQGTPGKRFTDDANFHILALDKLQYNGTLTTHSLNSWITDSGPGASAYACGKPGKLDNEAISFNVGTGESVESILEKAKKQGYAVGLVTTTRVTHATPATFGSHIWFRDLEDYIAAQYISSSQTQYEAIFNDPASLIKPYNPSRDWQLPAPKDSVEIDVILGGGARHFLPKSFNDTIKDAAGNPVLDAAGIVVRQTGKRADSVNLVALAQQRGYVYVNSRDALLNLDTTQFTPTNNKKVIGLFNASHVNYEQDRQMDAPWEPSLPEMTEMAIKILKAKGGSKGFFLLVEGGRIDHLEHANSGGITVVPSSPNNLYVVDADKRSYKGGGEVIYGATPTTPRHDSIYGSDYLIKEVLAFDYSVAQGRKLLGETNSKTLIFSSSDHECGGTAIVGLHDQNDAQNNGTMIRTYAMGPRQNGNGASSSGAATTTTVANPAGTQRGDIDFGTTSPNGWYPNYTTYTFQGRPELWPRVDTAGRRIVVSYASNPITNGNGAKAGGTPGNHTPMDVWVGAEDNAGGTYAGQIAGHGQLDNTYLTHIMAEFLTVDPTGLKPITMPDAFGNLELFPNPASGQAHMKLTLAGKTAVHITLTSISGQVVAELDNAVRNAGVHILSFSTAHLASGVYLVNVSATQGKITKKLIVQH
ncbi:alkaline phosphatase [Taibaiella koreensis]|uniref:alkaline phosphatase n=1 Tax=Taibaiella koreensis TaxID=1268548 RepID=UPI000E5A0D06|nr:alkaline phosphatase [Taibaiella koreensis]